MTNKKSGLQRSVETLGLSNYDDEHILTEIDAMIHGHERRQPFSRNILLRIRAMIDQYLNKQLVSQIRCITGECVAEHKECTYDPQDESHDNNIQTPMTDKY